MRNKSIKEKILELAPNAKFFQTSSVVGFTVDNNEFSVTCDQVFEVDASLADCLDQLKKSIKEPKSDLWQKFGDK